LVEVTALNLAGESLPASTSTILGSSPSVPQNVRITQSIPGTSITVAWDPPISSGCLPLTGYIFNVDGTDETGLGITADKTEVTYAFPVGNGNIGDSVVINLRAANKKAEGIASEDISVTVGSVPNAPTGLTVESRPSKTSLVLSWTADVAIANNQETTAYRLYRLNIDGTEELMFDTSETFIATEATLTGLNTGESYEFVVRAMNNWGESADSTSLTATAGMKPSQPPLPRLTSSTSVSLTLEISPSADNGGAPITKYYIYYREEGAASFTIDTDSTPSSLDWSKSGFAPSSLIEVKVQAENSLGLQSDFSNLVTFIVAGVPATPSAPTLASTPVEQADGSIAATLQWTAPADNGSGITAYTLYYKDAQSSGGYEVAYTGRADTLQYTHKNLTKSMTYYYKVSATNRAGESDLTTTPLSLLAAAAPSKPRNLMVTATSSGGITVSWSRPVSNGGSSLTGYIIGYRLASASSFTDSTTVSAGATSKALSSLSPAQQYVIRVYATNSVAGGTSPPSASVYGYADSVPTGLTDPTVTDGGRGTNSLKIGWAAVIPNTDPDNDPGTPAVAALPITGYRVFANPGDGSYPTQLVYDGKTDPTRTHATISNLTAGREYKFVYTALNAAGESSPSGVLTATVGKLPEPPARPPQLISSTSSSIEFSWEASAESYGMPILNYHIYESSSTTPIASVGATVYSYGATGLTSGTSYTYSVAAETAIGIGRQSFAKTFYAVDVPGTTTLTVTEQTRDT
jgi:hypothetical protein